MKSSESSGGNLRLSTSCSAPFFRTCGRHATKVYGRRSRHCYAIKSLRPKSTSAIDAITTPASRRAEETVRCSPYSARNEGGRMRIIGCDLHARQQTLAMLDAATGEVVEVTLKHEGDNVREFYSSLPRPVRVGIEATGSMQW